MDKTYDPQGTEQRLYDWWEAQGYFKPETLIEKGLADPAQPAWCITMPPPNITGALHLGHAIVAAIEDLMTRYYRMRGRETLFLPGSDHAGIATQNVVERELGKQGITRFDLGRDKFVEKVWEWKHVYHARITEQTRRLGVSCDWTRERFTLDEGLSHAVRTAFVRLYQKGLIYRGAYLVNWCPRCESAISDLEAISEEQDDHLWTIRYPIVTDEWSGPQQPWGSGRWAEGATEFIEMATARPETIMGDTAVATHAGHERFARLIGRTAVLPIMDRRIPIIDDIAVDPEFGTGAVKVTPAHDPDDYEIRAAPHLEAPTVLTDTGKMNELAGPYAGLDRYEARDAVVRDFEREGLLLKIEPYHHSVAHCERCHTVIEPRISTQWWLNVKPLAEAAMAAVSRGETTIIPEREERRFFQWMEQIRPWCISRQLWWGHRIPVWYCDACDQQTCGMEDPNELRPLRQRPDPPGPRRARHLVQLWAVAVQHARLARRHARPAPLLPDDHARDRLRHPLFLGGARDDARHRDDRPGAVPNGVPARSGQERGWEKDQQVDGEYRAVRPAAPDRRDRRRRAALHAADQLDAGQRHEPRPAPAGGGAQLC